ncbi:MAG: hypothetical protein FWH38_00900 [Treponema sp.]|nr:hypothetical protein [Treponema sp.]
MKKLLIFSLIAAIVAGAAFAQLADGISVNGWGRAAFSPLTIMSKEKADGDTIDGSESEAYAGTGVSWGGPKARVDFRISGATDYIGFGVGSTAEDGDGLGMHEYGAHIWAQPFGTNVFKLTAGKFIDDTLRGKIGNLDSGFSNFVLMDTPEEDAIFRRFGAGNDVSTNGGYPNSFMLSSVPVDGLFLGFMVDGALWNWGGHGSGTRAEEAYRYMQFGAGYEIADIGHIRAQYIGGWFGTVDRADQDWIDKGKDGWWDPSKQARIEAAFALTAVQGLLVDLGAKIWLPLEEKDAYKTSNGLDFSLGVTYGMDALGIGFRADISGIGAYDRHGDASTEYKDDKSNHRAHMVFRLVPTYALDFATLGLDAAFAIDTAGKNVAGDSEENNGSQFGIGAFIQKGLAGGQITAGLSFTLPPSNKDGAQGRSAFSIPVLLEYAFF